MAIGLVTCAEVAGGAPDDEILVSALGRRGMECAHPVWDDPTVDWGSFDACVVRATWDYMDRREQYLAWAEHVHRATHLFNPAPVLAWNTHKGYLRELETQGVPIVPTVWLRQGERVDLGELLARREWNACIVKPCIGATARESVRCLDDSALPAAQAHLDRMLGSEDMMVQPYLATVEERGERSAVFIDGRFSHAVQKLPAPGDYRVQCDFDGTDSPCHLDPAAAALAEAAVAALPRCASWPAKATPPPLYARVDMLTDENGTAMLSELELVEPMLFFEHRPEAADTMATVLHTRLTAASDRAPPPPSP